MRDSVGPRAALLLRCCLVWLGLNGYIQDGDESRDYSHVINAVNVMLIVMMLVTMIVPMMVMMMVTLMVQQSNRSNRATAGREQEEQQQQRPKGAQC